MFGRHTAGCGGPCLDSTPEARAIWFGRKRRLRIQSPVLILCFGVSGDFPVRGNRLGRGSMNVTAIPDLSVCVARPIVADQAQRLPSPLNQCQAAGIVLVVVQVLTDVDLVHSTAFGRCGEVPLSMSTGLLPPSGARIRYPFRGRPKTVELIVRHQRINHPTSPLDVYLGGRMAVSPRSASMAILVVPRQGCEHHGR